MGAVSFLALVTFMVFLPAFFSSGTVVTGEGLVQRISSDDDGLPNYDIRLERSEWETLGSIRERSGVSALVVADLRDAAATGEKNLRTKLPELKIEYSERLGWPEIISPRALLGRQVLTKPNSGQRASILKDFIRKNAGLFGITSGEVNELKVAADYSNPENSLSYAILRQEIDGVPVFQGTVRAGFSRHNEIFRIINDLGPGLGNFSTSHKDGFGEPEDAVRAAAEHIGHTPDEFHSRRDLSGEDGKKVAFGSGDWATVAEKVYFPTEPGVAVPAWKVLFWLPTSAYYVVVDAGDGKLLWRKNISEDQTQPATYNVFANPNAMAPVADSPNPFTPGPPSPLLGTQGPRGARTLVTRVGNEPPYGFNNNGWITDGDNTTDGNAVEAGIDREQPNGVDPNGKPVPTVHRVFDYPFNPANPSGVPDIGEPPLPPGTPVATCAPPGGAPPMTDFQKAVATQLFYIVNLFHDEAYRLGFVEAAFNFQHDNFGRGGTGGDRISAEAQECTGSNGGNFSTAADGNRGRMQLYIWTIPEPDHDGALDAEVAIHELTHGLSNRLHGNAVGLTTNMARGLGEGWSDFYAMAMLSEPDDALGGIYTVGGYSFYRPMTPSNYYYGVRRFPTAIMSSLGGPNDRPHNPLTFADIDSTQINITDGAFPAQNMGGSADAVHPAGEIWNAALWEIRARYIQRLGWEAGNRRVLQHVTDGMKISPLAPTFLQARDSVVLAALVDGTAADLADVWAGFAIRGIGASASIQNTGTGNGNTRVTEAFDTPNLTQSPALTVSDQPGNGNGYPEPGEDVLITLPLTNNTGITAEGVTVQLQGGGNADYGNIPGGTTVSRDISFTVPAGAPCGGLVSLVFDINSSLGPVSVTRTIVLGEPQVTFAEDFDGVTAPTFPDGWTAEAINNGINFVTATDDPDSPPNSAFALNPTTVGGGTNLTSPPIPITTSGAQVNFRNNYATEAGWDGGVLEISIGEGGFQDIILAGGSFVQNGYNGVLGANGVNNPLAGRQAWTGNSGGYITTMVRFPPAAAGQTVRLRWRFGADNNTAVIGWHIDSVSVVGSHSCEIPDRRTRADFDGDGRTDVSFFRPSEGIWYIERSTLGFIGYSFGNSADILVPGDFDGDGRADVAVWRPSNGTWYLLRSSGGFTAFQFGAEGDIPVIADFDGDGMDDPAVFRPSTGVWYILKSTGGIDIHAFGRTGDRPVPGDYDGDGKADIAVYRDGQWWILLSSGGHTAFEFGNATDKPANADYDGDGRDDPAVFRPSNGIWYILRSSDLGVSFIPFGNAADIPVPGDYDGDGKADQAVYRAGVWYINRSSGGFSIEVFGSADDRPVPAAYLP